MKNLEITLEDGDKLIIPEGVYLLTKKADSYYRSSISSIYKNHMHDVRGVVKVFNDEKEALEILFGIALDSSDDNSHESDGSFKELKEDYSDEQDFDGSWYEGEGIYNGDKYLIFSEGETSFEDDLRYFSVTTIEDEMEYLSDDEKYSLAQMINSMSYHEIVEIIEVDEEE